MTWHTTTRAWTRCRGRGRRDPRARSRSQTSRTSTRASAVRIRGGASPRLPPDGIPQDGAVAGELGGNDGLALELLGPAAVSRWPGYCPASHPRVRHGVRTGRPPRGARRGPQKCGFESRCFTTFSGTTGSNAYADWTYKVEDFDANESKARVAGPPRLPRAEPAAAAAELARDGPAPQRAEADLERISRGVAARELAREFGSRRV